MEVGSFSATADRIGVPKSTLSRRIAALETRLGQQLITRSTRRLAITDFGERILEHARRLQDEVQSAADLAQQEQVQPKGLLRVSLPPDLAQIDLTSMLIRYAAAYPQVQIEIDLSPRRVDILAERYDLAVRIANNLPDDGTLVARQLCQMPIHLYASPAYLTQFGAPEHPSALLKHVCLRLINSSGEAMPWRLSKQQGTEQGLWEGLPTGSVSSNSPALQRGLALQGMGIVALADVLVSDALVQGHLNRVLPEWSLPTATVWSVTPGRRLLPLKTRAFMKMLRDAMTTDLGPMP
jgi:DNA-binding transcriptional LysR family regulator